MANKKISELTTRTPSLSDLILVGDPSNGFSYKCTVSALATIIETDIADGYVTLGTTQTISGAKTFSNNLTLTSVANASTDPDKFLVLNGSNVVNYRTGSEVLSDIGGQGTITLTTTGTSGAATLVGNTLNIPNYAPDLSGYVPTSRTITINGTTQDLTANRTYNVGTVTSVAASGGTGISISGSPITSSGTITITNTAPDQIVALTAGTGISISGTYPNFTITNSSPSLGGTVTSVALSAPTGFAVTGSPITSSGTLALAFASGYSLPTTASQTNWDSAYNNMIVSAAVTGTTTKTLTLTQQDAGTITASWTDDNTDAVTSVFGRTGAVVAVSGDYNTSQVTESTNLYFTDARARGALSAGTGISYSTTTGVIASTITQYTDAMARAAISLTTTGSSGSATYSNTTGVLNIPTYTLAGLGGISLTSLSAFVPLIYNNTTGQFSITQSNSTNDGYLSATDWNTFNNKQATITLTTTGTSGAATFTSNTLNIPQYQGALTLTTTGTSGAATLVGNTLNIPQYSGGGGSVSGTTNYIAKFTSSTAVGDSQLFDNGTNVGISTATAGSKLQVNGNAAIGYSASTAAPTNGLAVSGGVSIATTFSAWSGVTGILQFGSHGTLVGFADLSAGATILGNNAFFNGTNWTYIVNGFAGNYNYSSATGNHFWRIANSGTAGNSVTFTQAMTLNSSGVLILGNGETASSPSTGIISGTGGTGTNIAGAELRLRGGASTGNAAGGIISFYTSAAGSAGTGVNAATERARFTTAGNLGIGTNTSAWGSVFRVLELGNGASIYNWTGGNLGNVTISSNAYEDASLVSRYINTNGASSYLQNNGEHRWSYAASGTAGNAITYTVGMNLNNSGNLGINTTTIGSRLQVNGNAAIGYSASTAAPTNGLMVAGNVGVNVTPSAWASGFRAIQIGARASVYSSDISWTGLSNNTFYDGVTYKYITTAQASTIELGAGVITFGNAPSGTAGTTITATERMRIDTDGVIYVGNAPIAASPNTGIISATGGSGTNIAGAEFRIRGGASTGSAAGGPITFYTSAAGTSGTAANAAVEVMRITGAGVNSRVGIGTNSPNYRFEVAGLTNVGTAHFTHTGVNGGINVHNTGSLSIARDAQLRLVNGSTFFGANDRSYQLVNEATSTTAADFYVQYWDGTNYTRRFVINPSGNIGIATNTIGSRLQVNGGAAIGYSASTAAPTNGLAVAGDVGIGTNTPSGALHVSTSGMYSYFATNSQGGTLANIQGLAIGWNRSNGSGETNLIYNRASGSVGGLSFANNDGGSYNERMLLTSNGELQLKPAANTAALTTSGSYSLTGSNASSLIDLAGTWNTTGNPTAIKLNITNTASGATADLMELQVGGVNQFLVTKAGNISLGGSITTDTPTGGTKKAWKLGSVVVTGSWVIDSSRYVEVEIDGTAYKLALAIAP